AIGVESSGIIALVLVGVFRRRIGWVRAGDDGQQLGRVAHIVGHRAGGVLAVADRDDMRSADEPDGGLETYDPVDRRWTSDRTVGLRADRHADETGGDGRAAAARRTAGIPVERPWIVRLPADRA